MKKKTTIFIRDGEVRNYQDPLRRLAPVEKISSRECNLNCVSKKIND